MTAVVADAVAYTPMVVEGGAARQADTCAGPAGRGHRLGTVAKPRNLGARAARHPPVRHVHTSTAKRNDPRGFRPVERVRTLRARLDGRPA